MTDVRAFVAREPGKAALCAAGGVLGGFAIFYIIGRAFMSPEQAQIVVETPGRAPLPQPQTEMVPEIVVPTKTVRTPDARRATLRADALHAAPALAFLPSGTVVTVLSWLVSEGTVWYQVQPPGEVPGWVRGDLLV